MLNHHLLYLIIHSDYFFFLRKKNKAFVNAFCLGTWDVSRIGSAETFRSSYITKSHLRDLRLGQNVGQIASNYYHLVANMIQLWPKSDTSLSLQYRTVFSDLTPWSFKFGYGIFNKTKVVSSRNIMRIPSVYAWLSGF